jgi:aspartyl/glutamyl-tRNA(Asn/Gln) amidotransferase C subunit
MLDPKQIDNLAELARLAVPPEERAKLLQDLEAVLKYVSSLPPLEPEAGRPRAPATSLTWRADAPSELEASNLFGEEIKTRNGLVVVPTVRKPS